MQRGTFFLALATAALVVIGATDAQAREARSKAGHRFNGSIELQYRSNDNIAIARSSGERFDFASLAQFGDEDDVDQRPARRHRKDDHSAGECNGTTALSHAAAPSAGGLLQRTPAGGRLSRISVDAAHVSRKPPRPPAATP